MSPTPLEVLKQGLISFSQKIKERKDKLNAKLKQHESLSPVDEEWLDNEANIVDEQQILELLESASDYEQGLACLDDKGKAIVEKLREWAGELPVKLVGNKRKRKHNGSRFGVEDADAFDNWSGSDKKKEVKDPKTKSADTHTAPNFVKKENATLAQRIEILDWYHKHKQSQTKTAEHFASIYPNVLIKQPLISSWLKDEAKWRARWHETNRESDRTAKRARQTEHPAVSEMLDLWVSKAMADGILLTGGVLRQKWYTFADLVGVPADERLNLSNGWLTRFKERNGLKEWKRHGEASSSNAETVEEERKRVQKIIQEQGYGLKDIYNMDETGLFYGHAPRYLLLAFKLIQTHRMVPN